MVGVMFLPIAAAVPATIGIVVLSAILIACLKEGSAAYQFFTLDKVVYVGLISYSLYLWHWTVLSISRWTIGIHWWSVPIQAGLMLLLAVCSYNWLEKPIRNIRNLNRKSVFAVGIIAVLASAHATRLMGSNKNFYIGDRSSVETDLIRIEERDAPLNNCTGYEESLRFDSCAPEAGKNMRRVAIIGDSFSTHMLLAMKMLAHDYHINIIYKKMRWGIWYPSPPPPETIIRKRGVSDDEMSNAVSSTRFAVNQLIDRLGNGDAIVFSTFLPHYFTEQSANKAFRFYRQDNTLISRAQALKNWEDGIAVLANRGKLKGIAIVLISPMPQFTSLYPNGIACIKQWFNIDSPCSKGVSRGELDQDYASIFTSLERLKSAHSNILVVNPMDSFCSETKCVPYDNGDLYFIDSIHMSSKGAERFYNNKLKAFMASEWLGKTQAGDQH